MSSFFFPLPGYYVMLSEYRRL